MPAPSGARLRNLGPHALGEERHLLVEVSAIGGQELDHQVLTAADGQEALEVLRQQPGPIHLVLSDLVMPRLGGRGLYDAARREGITTPFLFASGYSPGDDRGSLPPELGVPLLHKPWTHDDVLTRVREILDRK